jgi:hypothetical protein
MCGSRLSGLVNVFLRKILAASRRAFPDEYRADFRDRTIIGSDTMYGQRVSVGAGGDDSPELVVVNGFGAGRFETHLGLSDLRGLAERLS